METVQSVRVAIRPQDWTCSIDLKDAYLHVPIHLASYRYLRLGMTCKFPRTSGRSRKIAHASYSVLAKLPLQINDELQDALVPWTDADWLPQGVPLLALAPDCYLFTDSSLEGWRASLSGKDITDVWRKSDTYFSFATISLQYPAYGRREGLAPKPFVSSSGRYSSFAG